MNAIVLAGGFGSRLKPLTNNQPKPMLPLANRPTLDYAVSQLRFYGITDIVFSLGFMPETVINHASGYKGISCRFSVEEMPLGTAGGVKKAEDMLDDIFVVLSGDAVSDIDLNKMLDKHLSDKNEVTIAATDVENPTLYGVLQTDGDRVKALIEKPKTSEFGRLVSTGIYIINKSVLSLVPQGVSYDFARDLFPSLVSSGKVGVYRHDGYWCDIGDKKSYYNANFFLSDGELYPMVKSSVSRSKLINGNLISNSAVIVGKCRQSIIGEGARVASSAFVDGCVILPFATVKGWYKNCIVGNGFCERISFFDGNGGYSTDGGNKLSYKER